MIRYVLVLPLLVACCGCYVEDPSARSFTAGDDTDEPRADGLAPGLHLQVRPLSNGSQQRYTLFVPDTYSEKPGPPSPLILALHYGGEVTPHYGRGLIASLVGPGLGDIKAVILAPDSLGGDWSTAANESAVLELLDEIIQAGNIDPRKVVITGFSMGGAGTWYLAGRHPDRFCAAIPIAARPAGAAPWTVPTYVIHSRADTVVPFQPAAAHARKLRASGADVTFVAVDDIPHHQTGRFATALKGAVPWLRSILDGTPNRPDSDEPAAELP